MRISDWSSDVCSSDLTGCFRERNRGPLIRQYGNTAGSGGDELLAKVVEGLLDVRDGQRAQPVRIARQPGVEHLAMFLVRALVAAQRLEMLAHIALRQDMEPFEEIDRDRLPRSLQQREVERAIDRKSTRLNSSQ